MTLDGYSGATRVIFIVGDPIAQVKSPQGVTESLRARGADAIVVPAHVRPADLAVFFALAERMPNVDGIIVTVPHKFDAA
jgi:shikimate dehydrogenase